MYRVPLDAPNLSQCLPRNEVGFSGSWAGREQKLPRSKEDVSTSQSESVVGGGGGRFFTAATHQEDYGREAAGLPEGGGGLKEDQEEENEEEEEEFDLGGVYRETRYRAMLGGIDGRYTLVSKFVSPEEQAKRVQVSDYAEGRCAC